MEKDSDDRELSMDELNLVNGGAAIPPLTPHIRQDDRGAGNGLFGIVDDSV